MCQVERAHKSVESELHDAANHMAQLASNHDALQTHKRKIESDLASASSDLEEAQAEVNFIKQKNYKFLCIT